VALGWSDDQLLLCVEEGGNVLPYSVHGELQPNQFSLGSEVCSAWPVVFALQPERTAAGRKVHLTVLCWQFSPHHASSADWASAPWLVCLPSASNPPIVFIGGWLARVHRWRRWASRSASCGARGWWCSPTPIDSMPSLRWWNRAFSAWRTLCSTVHRPASPVRAHSPPPTPPGELVIRCSPGITHNNAL
jgi:hypothetical protein